MLCVAVLEGRETAPGDERLVDLEEVMTAACRCEIAAVKAVPRTQPTTAQSASTGIGSTKSIGGLHNP